MSKNEIYTFNYFQPEEYRFSLDSVFLAQQVAKKYQDHSQLSSLKILDLCSGCGVIGLELSIHLKSIEHIDFIEVQEIYFDYFQNNLFGIHQKNKSHFNFLNQNYEELLKVENQNKYDLIISNPPYFLQGEGILSPNQFKNRCRFFIDSNFENLFLSIVNSLKINGEAFILVRSGSHHGRDILKSINDLINNRASADIFDEVRGTQIVRIIKKR